MLYNDFLKKLGLKIKMKRIQLGLTQANLGEKVGISENRLSEIESGRCNITIKSLHKIFSALQVDLIESFKF